MGKIKLRLIYVANSPVFSYQLIWQEKWKSNCSSFKIKPCYYTSLKKKRNGVTFNSFSHLVESVVDHLKILFQFLFQLSCFPQPLSAAFISHLKCITCNFSAAAAESLQSCPTLCDPIDGSPPSSPVPEILQARTPEWVAVSFSSA